MNKLMLTALTTFLVLTTACSNVRVNPVEHRGYSIEKEVLPYVKRFEKDCNKQVKMHIRFERIRWDLFQENVAAYCFDLGITYIHIDYDWWIKNSMPDIREETVYHELGHCVLKRGHIKDKTYTDDFGGRPVSIMYPYVFGYWGEYTKNRDYYIKELCKK